MTTFGEKLQKAKGQGGGTDGADRTARAYEAGAQMTR